MSAPLTCAVGMCRSPSRLSLHEARVAASCGDLPCLVPPENPLFVRGTDRGTWHALALLTVQGPPEGLAREGARVLTVVQQHLAIDDHIIYPHGALLDVHLTTRERIHGLARLGANGVRVKDRDVRSLAGGKEAAVMQ